MLFFLLLSFAVIFGVVLLLAFAGSGPRARSAGGPVDAQQEQRHAAFASFVDDDDWFCDGDVIRARDLRRPAQLRPLTGPNRTLAGWHLELDAIRLSERTTLSLAARHPLQVLLGAGDDVEIGVAHFDAAWVIRGSAPNVVRGVIAAVWQRLEAFLVSSRVSRLNVDKHGRLTIETSHNDTSNEVIRALLNEARGVAAVLEEASAAQPVPARVAELSSSSAASGAPVAVTTQR